MTLQQLTYLVTVADCGNITEAAEKLFISQPSLSAAIHNLEKEMGVTAFTRSNKGVTVTREGEELLSFARMLLEQADNMKEHFGNGERRTPKFSVSCQHYSFAVNAFVDLIKEYDADQYSFIIRETQTGEIIEDVASGKSEIGVLYLSEHNEDVILKLIKNNQLKFEEMFVAEPHVFICKDHPLAEKEMISMEEIAGYMRMEFSIPARGLIGFRNELLTTTRGTGIMYHVFQGYAPYKGDIPERTKGSLVAFESGTTTAYGLNSVLDRGELFLEPGVEVYEGMIVGENARDQDMDVNPCKKKHLTNTRASGSDDAIKLPPCRKFTLEGALEWINDDELVEVTPKSIRMRKMVLSRQARYKDANVKKSQQ